MHTPASDLDGRIALAERALVARDQRVHLQARAVGSALEQRVQRWRQPSPLRTTARWLLAWWFPGIAGALGAVGAVGAARRPAPHQQGGVSGHGLSWAMWLPLLWPLMPAGVRRRISAAHVVMLVGLAVPLLAWLRLARAPSANAESASSAAAAAAASASVTGSGSAHNR